MHEMSVLLNIFETVEETLRKQFENTAEVKVEKITLQAGKLSMVVPEALQFAFTVAREGTIFQKALLDIKEIPLVATCNECGEKITMDRPVFTCTKCDSFDLHIISGRELFIESVEIEEE
ncbi:MAG: hydrogenase maturation nickel metallochaperone HypA [Candidatus Xenobiia bacterium LiM19]